MHRNDRIIIIIGLFVVLIALVGAAFGGAPKIEEVIEEELGDFRDWPVRTSPKFNEKGYSTENSIDDEVVVINITESYVTEVYIELLWDDEDPDYMNYENQPDMFNFTVYPPWDTETGIASIDKYNEADGSGQIIEIIQISEERVEQSAAIGEWTIKVHCSDCGDQVPVLDITGLRRVEDTGNAWTLNYDYSFHTNN